MSGPDRLVLHGASVRLDSMPHDGREISVVPDAEERAALAAQVGVSSVEDLKVELKAVRFRGGFRVTGTLDGKVVQPSVVTLKPLTQAISEEIDRVFLPGGEKQYAGPANAEIFVDLEGDELPDHFEGNEADLSDLIVETLALGVDLYPREEGETIADTGYQPDADNDSPFAVLKTLKPEE